MDSDTPPPALCKNCRFFVFNKADIQTHRCKLILDKQSGFGEQIAFTDMPIVRAEYSCESWSAQDKPSYKSVKLRKMYGTY